MLLPWIMQKNGALHDLIETISWLLNETNEENMQLKQGFLLKTAQLLISFIFLVFPFSKR